MNKLPFLILFTIYYTAFLTGCSGTTEEPMSDIVVPSNLTIEISIADDNSGKVSIQAQADNTILYEFDMGTPFNDTGSSEDGKYDFVYEISGVYTLEVKAYGNSGQFITSEKKVNIISGDPSTSGEGYVTPVTYDDWNLIWNDEFDGSALDQSSWTYQNGNGCPDLCGWGNNELQYYRPENSRIENGLLTIEAREENHEGFNYTSTKLITEGKQAFSYGRIDVRAKLPRGQGLWPAVWMLGTNIPSVGWPACGEIDIMEMIGGQGRENISHGTAHWRNRNNEHSSHGDKITAAEDLDQAFHVFSIIWNQREIKWLLDDVSFHALNTTGSELAAFHKPFYMIVNVAVGGNWPGQPSGDTQFPTQMQVDYIRIFQEK